MLVAGARAGTAQLRADADVAFNSHFVWRGVTSTNRLVVQPEVLLSAPVRGLTLLAGVWGNIEGGIFDLYEIVPGFLLNLVLAVVVSNATHRHHHEVTDEFDRTMRVIDAGGSAEEENTPANA